MLGNSGTFEVHYKFQMKGIILSDFFRLEKVLLNALCMFTHLFSYRPRAVLSTITDGPTEAKTDDRDRQTTDRQTDMCMCEEEEKIDRLFACIHH